VLLIYSEREDHTLPVSGAPIDTHQRGVWPSPVSNPPGIHEVVCDQQPTWRGTLHRKGPEDLTLAGYVIFTMASLAMAIKPTRLTLVIGLLGIVALRTLDPAV